MTLRRFIGCNQSLHSDGVGMGANAPGMKPYGWSS